METGKYRFGGKMNYEILKRDEYKKKGREIWILILH